MHRMMGLVSAQLLIAVIPAAAEPRCAEMPLLQTLEAEAKAGKPASEVVEALLRDAEKIYTESAQIVAWKPRTERPSNTILDRNFRIVECHFQDAFSSVLKAEGLEEKLRWTLIRIEQFDNFIFDAINEAVTCANTEGGRRLKVSRELLDHAWMEFKGNTKERDWDPNLDWPESHELCR